MVALRKFGLFSFVVLLEEFPLELAPLENAPIRHRVAMTAPLVTLLACSPLTADGMPLPLWLETFFFA